jgi:hypothetical protein
MTLPFTKGTQTVTRKSVASFQEIGFVRHFPVCKPAYTPKGIYSAQSVFSTLWALFRIFPCDVHHFSSHFDTFRCQPSAQKFRIGPSNHEC